MALSFQKRGCSVRFKQRSDWNARSKILEIQCLSRPWMGHCRFT